MNERRVVTIDLNTVANVISAVMLILVVFKLY